MKKTIYPILVFVAILIIACNNPEKVVIENPYEGAWEVTYVKYVYPDSTIETTQFANPQVKLLTKKHYAFGYQAGENQIEGGGGEYAYDGDTFTSYPKYHYYPGMVGNSLVTKSTIEGDLWTISFVIKDDTIQVDATQTWKRIIE